MRRMVEAGVHKWRVEHKGCYPLVPTGVVPSGTRLSYSGGLRHRKWWDTRESTLVKYACKTRRPETIIASFLCGRREGRCEMPFVLVRKHCT